MSGWFPLIVVKYFQEIELELRQMEELKDLYQKKNYEQVASIFYSKLGIDRTKMLDLIMDSDFLLFFFLVP